MGKEKGVIENMLSAIVIIKNEEQRLMKCLQQLEWADEIIVVDNESTDSSVNIARQFGATVVSIPDKDFSKLRMAGAQKATNDWILYIDIDEVITDQLKTEIEKITSHSNPQQTQAYVLKRTNYYLGVKWPTQDGMIRLIYKPSLIRWYGQLHETAEIKGDVGELQNRLEHYTHQSLEHMVNKTNEWSTIEAQLRYDANHPQIVQWRILRVMISGFWNSYINEGGWRLKTAGLIESIYQGFSMFITYSKLWEMQSKSSQIKKSK